MGLVLGLVGVVVALFLSDRLRVDVVAILAMLALPFLGLIDPRQTFQGLASNAVVSIIAVIIMGRGLDHTGIINRSVKPLMRLAGGNKRRIILILSVTVAVISSIMQNIGAAALFLPAIQRMSRQSGIPIPQILMPVGFAAILGGTVTLVGSSPLIMLNDLMAPYDLAPFSLFDTTPIGVVLIACGIGYFVLFGKYVVPRGEPAGPTELRPDPLDYYPQLGELREIEYPSNNTVQLRVQDLCDVYNIHAVALATNGDEKLMPPDREMRISPGNVFAAYGGLEKFELAAQEFGFIVRDEPQTFAHELSDDISGVVEGVIAPRSAFIGRTLSEIRFRHRHLIAPLALSRGDEIFFTGLGHIVLEAGDTLLMHGTWEAFSTMRPRRDMLFAQSLDHEVLLPRKAAAAGACFGLATLLVLVSELPLSVCLMTGALGMVLTRVLTIEEAYRGVDWRTVFLLAGLIPLGAAMQQSGAAAWMASSLLDVVGTPPAPVFYLLIGLISTVITLVVSNVGAVVLLVPLAVDMSARMGMDPRFAALVVGIAASNSFMLPTHQVNALYMGPGGYKAADFLKAGAPLSIIFLVVLALYAMLVS
jgi:di/tricarboxylate transporter